MDAIDLLGQPSRVTAPQTSDACPMIFSEADTERLQVFDVSNNSLTGPVPPFLYVNNVPPWTQPTVFIQVRGPGSMLREAVETLRYM